MWRDVWDFFIDCVKTTSKGLSILLLIFICLGIAVATLSYLMDNYGTQLAVVVAVCTVLALAYITGKDY